MPVGVSFHYHEHWNASLSLDDLEISPELREVHIKPGIAFGGSAYHALQIYLDGGKRQSETRIESEMGEPIHNHALVLVGEVFLDLTTDGFADSFRHEFPQDSE